MFLQNVLNLDASYKHENNLKIVKIKQSEAEQKNNVQSSRFFSFTSGKLSMLHNIDIWCFIN